MGSAGADNTSALAFAGYITTEQTITEEWNGTSWTEVADLSTARSDLGGSGSATAALAIGGAPAAVEEWNSSIAQGAWATGGSVNTARRDLG